MIATLFRLLFATLALAAITTPAAAEWYEASSEHFVIYADDKAADIQTFAENLERYHSAMVFVTGRKSDAPSPSNRVVIYVVGGERAMKSLSGDKKIGGFYIPRAGGSRAFVQDIRNQKNGYPDFSTIILLHEYAHHFLLSSSRFAKPRWLDEGAAEFFASASFERDGSVWVGRPAEHRAGDLAFADPVHVRELFDPALYEQKKVKGYDTFYGKSWLLYHYLFFTETRRAQFNTYLVNLAQGMDQKAAGEAAFGDLDQLEKDLKAYLRQSRMSALKLPPDKLAIATVTLRKLTEGEGAMMPLQIRSQRGVGSEEAAVLLGEVRLVASKYPEDPGVLTALAEAEFDAGNDREAIAAADAALARDPARANAYVQKGYALFRQAGEAEGDARKPAFSAAIKPFVALNGLENDHPLPLVFFYRAQVARSGAPNENARAALERAAILAPFDHGLQIEAGLMLLGEGKIAFARTILAPVAANPHGGWAAARAKQLVAAMAEAPEGTPLDLSNLPEPVEVPEVELPGGEE
jgi:tetratricopeptide (TPR) repeat protein